MPSTCSSSPQQLGQPRLAVQVHAVVGGVLGDDDQLAHAVGRQLLGLGDHFFDRLGGVLAAHLGDRAERAQPVAAFGDLEIGEMPRRDPQPVAIGRARIGRRAETRSAARRAGRSADRPPCVISSRPNTPTRWSISGPVSSSVFFLPLGQAAGDDHAPRCRPWPLELQHLVDRGERLVPGPLDEPAGVDDHEVGPVRLVHQLVAVELQQAQASARYRRGSWGSPG